MPGVIPGDVLRFSAIRIAAITSSNALIVKFFLRKVMFFRKTQDLQVAGLIRGDRDRLFGGGNWLFSVDLGWFFVEGLSSEEGPTASVYD